MEEVEVLAEEDQIRCLVEVALEALAALVAYFHGEEAYQDDACLVEVAASVAFQVDLVAEEGVSHGEFHSFHRDLRMITGLEAHQRIIDEVYQLVTMDFVLQEAVQPRYKNEEKRIRI